MKKILIISANPKNTSKLRLDEEVREIEAGLQRSKGRDQFEIICKWAVRTDDLRRALLDYEPQIVHFSGHGAGAQGLALENNSGEMQLVSTESLARLFRFFQDKVECVFFKACYSETQAQAIHQHINYVIGMNQKIGDRAAIEFAVGFYDALGAGRTYDEAYELGCASIDLEGIPESSTPVLKSPGNIYKAGKSHASNLSPEQGRGEIEDGGDRNVIRLPKKPEQVTPNSTTSAFPLEEPDGQVPLNSAFYVERPPIETDCYEAILRTGALIRVKAPRQMGKSSLMKRILHHAEQQGYQTVCINFQEADAEFLNSSEKFLQWFSASITYGLNLPDKLTDHWKGILGSKNKCTNYFQRYLLAEIANPVALGLDEVDEVFKHPEIAQEFFGLLRSWHERAKNEPLWQKLRLVIVHSKEVYIPLNINQSPFNVGLPIELPELTQAQVQDLIQRYSITWSNADVNQLMQLMGGHPYLVRVALYQIARRRMTLEKLQQIAPTEEGPYGDHLRRHLLNIENDAKLLAAIRQVITANSPVDVGTTEAFQLRSMGLVKLQGNDVMPLCDLYRKYFCDRLGIN
ncbi:MULTISPECIES: AAA-like domain-containing protein [Fischerella]|uniref:AAA-like domain-containing protein n=1 Tax=Fischerella TaxID=1190 RepID=UPI000474E7FF|nr:AAA-like domain-containing protein [Fischerella muscicola]MBD2429829.1 AAA-like domain-containing protein [Fischerella sp. FACHB-380]